MALKSDVLYLWKIKKMSKNITPYKNSDLGKKEQVLKCLIISEIMTI
jgi:hypothetical protein